MSYWCHLKLMSCFQHLFQFIPFGMRVSFLITDNTASHATLSRSVANALQCLCLVSSVIFTLTLRLCCHGCSSFGKELLKETAAESYWAKLGISLEAMPVEQSYVKSEAAAQSGSSDDVLGMGLCSLLLTPKFKVSWITKWGFVLSFCISLHYTLFC